MAFPAVTSGSIGDRLAVLHREMRSDHPAIDRIAIALFDRDLGRLRTFAHSTVGDSPLARYEMPLEEMPCLASLAESRDTRVIHDLTGWPGCDREHTRRLIAAGFRSSLTSPLLDGDALLGFLFYDSPELAYFDELRRRRLEPYSQLAAALVASAIGKVKLLAAAVRATRRIVRLRDEETGAHLERMARYSRLIAAALPARYAVDDEYLAFLTLFAPLHDIGKIGVPDRVLLKPGKLDEGEFGVMRSHVEVGRGIVDMLAEEFDLATLPHVDMLRNVVLHHHEASDGSGYPRGLAGEDIPLEARIVRVADVFDALTSDRPYKTAWSDEDAIDFLRRRARSQFDQECVEALAAQLPAAADFRRHFAESAPAANSHEGYAVDL
jgi:HD-GYP domain-containing protein (c-di-GMP phosphodiesterase class II)